MRDAVNKTCPPYHRNLYNTFDLCIGSIWSTPYKLEMSTVSMTNQLAIAAQNKQSAHELVRCFNVRPNMSTVSKLATLPTRSSVDMPT